jgi:hypothetical protein
MGSRQLHHFFLIAISCSTWLGKYEALVSSGCLPSIAIVYKVELVETQKRQYKYKHNFKYSYQLL